MEKKYNEYINEINENEIYEKLTKYGLFSERIVPIFDMKSFFDAIRKPEIKIDDNKYSDYIRYKANRNNQLPRIIGIPTPFSHEILCKTISDNWMEIKTYFNNKTINEVYKKSRVHIRKMIHTEKLVDLNYENYLLDKNIVDDLIIGAKYVVKADIGNCYPSIYSHSIGWALVGKKEAKNNIGKSTWYNALDDRLRYTKDNETHGILIGPHTSNLISEIILCDIDSNLSKYKYTRHIDDYLCFCNTELEANEFIEDLQKELSKHDLLLNNKKTKIIKVPFNLNEVWTDLLVNYNFDFYCEQIKYNSIKSFFNLINKLIEQYENTSIIYFAWKILKDKKMTQNAMNYYLKISRYYLFNYPYLFPFFEKNIINKLNLDNNQIEIIIKDNLQNLINKNNFEGISYCLYFIKRYNINIERIISYQALYDYASLSNDCIVLLLSSLNVDFKELKRYKELARNIIKNNEMDRYWLFCYEILPASDLKGNWEKIKNLKVSFITI